MLEFALPSTCDALQCVYVGDAPSDGVAAKAAGMASIGVSWGSHSGPEWKSNFDYVADDAMELRILLGLGSASNDLVCMPISSAWSCHHMLCAATDSMNFAFLCW